MILAIIIFAIILSVVLPIAGKVALKAEEKGRNPWTYGQRAIAFIMFLAILYGVLATGNISIVHIFFGALSLYWTFFYKHWSDKS